MINSLSFDIEDWFQVENLKSVINKNDWDTLELRVEKNTENILSLLRENNTKATFFILGWIAERCPDLVNAINEGGHEIASHGYSHELVYSMTPEKFREDLKMSKHILEDIIHKRIYGYRAPSFSINKETLWALDILFQEGFKYDSSIFPTSFHDRYGFAGSSTTPFKWHNGLLEIPLAVYQLGKLNIPVAGGGYFRLFPYMYFRYFLKRLNKMGQSFTFYLHPWELDPGQPRVKVPLTYAFRHYVNLDKTQKVLKKLINDFQFERIEVVNNL